MSKLPMDLSKFKKVASDGDTSTFRHHEGHEITIAHNKLSTKLRGDLEKIPVSAEKQKEPLRLKDGTPSVGDHALPPELADLPQESSTPPTQDPGLAEQLGSAVRGSAGDSLGALGSLAGAVASPVGGFIKGLVGTPDADAAMTPGITASQEGAAATAAQPQSQPMQSQDPYGSTNAIQQNLEGLKQVGAGQEAEAQAIGQRGSASLAQEQAYQNNQQDNLSKFNAANAPILAARQALMTDITNGHVDPRKYIHDMTTGGKIANAIGLVLGGMGSGLTHGPNLAFQYMQNQIDKDLEAQKSDLGRKESLLSHNFEQSRNLADAYNMTRLQTGDMLDSHLRMEQDKVADPIAKAKIEQIRGLNQQQQSQIQSQMAVNRMRMGGVGGEVDPAKLVPMLVPPEHQKQVFAEIEAAQNTRKMSGAIMDAFEKAAKDNTVMKTGAGYLRTPPSVLAFHQAMQPTFKDLEGTVRQAAMDNTFHNTTPGVGDFPSSTNTKRAAVQDYLASKSSAPTAKAYGIDLSKFSSTAPYQRPNAQEGKIGTLPNGQRVIMRNGKITPYND